MILMRISLEIESVKGEFENVGNLEYGAPRPLAGKLPVCYQMKL